MIELQKVNEFWLGWVNGNFITLHTDLEILMTILKNHEY